MIHNRGMKAAQGVFSAGNQFISKYVPIAQLSPVFLQDQPTEVPEAAAHGSGWTLAGVGWGEGTVAGGGHSLATGPPAKLETFWRITGSLPHARGSAQHL